MTVQTHYTRRPVASDDERAEMQHRADLVQQVVTTEDYWMTASIQAGIASGAQETVVFGRNEHALHHYHRALLDALVDHAESETGVTCDVPASGVLSQRAYRLLKATDTADRGAHGERHLPQGR